MVSGRQQLKKIVQIRDHHVDDELSGSTKLKLHEEDNVQAKSSSLLTSTYHKSAVLACARAKVGVVSKKFRARVFKPYHLHFLSAAPELYGEVLLYAETVTPFIQMIASLNIQLKSSRRASCAVRG